MLDDFSCRYAEAKHVVIQGREDGFSQVGDEPSRLNADVTKVFSTQAGVRVTTFDDPRPDGYVFGYFEIPATVVAGLFVVSLKAVADDRTDSLFIGNLDDILAPPDRRPASIFSVRTGALGTTRGWHRSGPLAWARFEDIRLTTGSAAPGAARLERDLTAYVRSAPGGLPVDVSVSDDTAVDFMAMAWCEAPLEHGGYTRAIRRLSLAQGEPVVQLWGGFDLRTQAAGNPFVGDTPCDEARPLACFQHTGRPVPNAVSAYDRPGDAQGLARQWSQGRYRATEPVRGDAFATAADADRFCGKRFGAGWRVADLNLGGNDFAVSGEGGPELDGLRVWVDIKDQPYATCWARPGKAP